MTIDEALKKAGTKYRKDLLAAPLLSLGKALPHLKLRTGIQGKEVGGTLETGGEFIPYKKAKNTTDSTKITPREWETYLGDLLEEFDPHEIMGTLYTERTSKKADQMEIARLIAIHVLKNAGQRLYKNLFVAKRKAAGDSTKDLFNGYSTLFAQAITDGAVAAAKGNYTDMVAKPLNVNNVGDSLKELWNDKLHELLKERDVKLYCPPKLVELYKDWYQAQFGHVPWNVGYEQRKLYCSDDQCTFVPLSCMSGQDFIYFTVRENMLVGVDQMSDTETCEIRRGDNPKLAQIYAKTYFGTGIDTLMPEFIHGVKIKFD